MIFTALELIFIILFFFYHNYFFLFIILGLLFLSYKRVRKEVLIVSQLLIFVFCLFRFNYFSLKKVEIDNNSFMVIEKQDNYVILENNNLKYIYYGQDLEKGNTISIEGKISKITDDNDFNTYLRSQRIHYIIDGKVTSNDNHVSFNTRIINKLLTGKDANNRAILKLILFNQKDETNSEFYRYFELFSLNFLIVISGYHINLLFRKLDKTKVIKHLVCFIYLYLLSFSISSLKAYIYLVMKRFNKKVDWVFNNMDLLSLIMIALLIYNPSYCFQKGFIYSFTFSFIIDLLNNVFWKKSFKNRVLKRIFIYFSTIPLVLMNNYEINSLSFLVNLLLIYPISFLFLFSLVYLFLDKFSVFYKIYIYFLKLFLGFCKKYSKLLIFGKPALFVIIIFYLCLLVAIYFYQNKFYRKSLVFVLGFIGVLILQYNLPRIDSREIVYFLNVGQGDCAVLKIKNSKKVVVIDTGGNKYRDLALTKIIPFLKSKGIDEVDKIIISHDDFDHNGAKNSLVINFKVNRVIEDSLIDEVMIGDKIFKNLNVNPNRDNDGSIVLFGEYGGLNYLFTGDISSAIEEKLLKENNNLKIDILKVAHHGSKTSTSKEFVETIQPKIAIISVGKNNLYGHPNQEVLARLLEVTNRILRTDYHGDIGIYQSVLDKRIVIESN